MVAFGKGLKENEKADIFSLGLCIWEIITKIDLPNNGPKWQELRSGKLPSDEIYNNFPNLDENSQIILNEINILINQMVKKEPNDRPNAEELLRSNQYFAQKFEVFLKSIVI